MGVHDSRQLCMLRWMQYHDWDVIGPPPLSPRFLQAPSPEFTDPYHPSIDPVPPQDENHDKKVLEENKRNTRISGRRILRVFRRG